MAEYIDIVFDGPPGHVSGRFVEVELSNGAGVRVGSWIERADGFWVLRLSAEDIDNARSGSDSPPSLKFVTRRPDEQYTEYIKRVAASGNMNTELDVPLAGDSK